MRLQLQNISGTLIPSTIGCCADDFTTLAAYLNEAIQRLIEDRAFGETGPWGTWRKIVFNVDPLDPIITQPREVARLANLDICRWPAAINNEWYEMLEAGPGLQSTTPDCCELAWNWGWSGSLPAAWANWGNCRDGRAVFDRGTACTAYELTPTNQYLRLYITNPADIGRRLLISGAVDQNGARIYTQDGAAAVDGFYLTADQPFATSAMIVTNFLNVAKDASFGEMILKEVDATTGVERTLARYQPDELNPSYRRYFFKSLPRNAVTPATDPVTYRTVQVTAMAKLEFIPLVRATDFLLIGNIPALREECASIKDSRVDDNAAQQRSILKHKNAVKRLKGELVHYLGNQKPAVTMAISGLEGMRAQRIGSMV